MREQNNLRLDPTNLIGDLEDLLTNRNTYYHKKKIAQEAVGDKNLDDAVSCNFYPPPLIGVDFLPQYCK